jgi:hypothetical protein
MDPNNGRLYPSVEHALAEGVEEPVEIVGTPDAVSRISAAVRAQHQAKRKAQKKARKAHRG